MYSSTTSPGPAERAQLRERLKRSKGVTPESFADMRKTGTGDETHEAIVGPATLHRFGYVNFGETQWWFRDDEFQRARAKANADVAAGGSYNDTLRRVLRERLAIALDWNDLAIYNALHLPDGVRVEAFVSTVAPQPLVVADGGRIRRTEPVPSLGGGGKQIWLFPVPAWINTRPAFLKGG
jgi:hypothetical protein